MAGKGESGFQFKFGHGKDDPSKFFTIQYKQITEKAFQAIPGLGPIPVSKPVQNFTINVKSLPEDRAYHFQLCPKMGQKGPSFGSCTISPPACLNPNTSPDLESGNCHTSKSLDAGGTATGYVGMWSSIDGAGPNFEYGYGVSYYTRIFRPMSAYWQGGQMGLASQWIVAPGHSSTCGWDYQTIEGGPFINDLATGPSYFPKFAIGSANHCYNRFSVASYAWGYYNLPNACDHLGFIALSNRLLLSPTGISFPRSQSSKNIYLGVNWLALPFRPEANSLSWTLFFDTANFKGPVGFFMDEYWLRNLPSDLPSSQTLAFSGMTNVPPIAMEVNTLPLFQDKQWMAIPQLFFPHENQNEGFLLNMRVYNKDIYNSFVSFMESGADTFIPNLNQGFSAFRNVSGFGGLGLRTNAVDSAPEGRFELTDQLSNLRISSTESSLTGNPTPCASSGSGCDQIETNLFFSWKPSGYQVLKQFPQYFKQINIQNQNGKLTGNAQITSPANLLSDLIKGPFQYAVETQFHQYGAMDPNKPNFSCWAGGDPKVYTLQLEDGGIVSYRWYKFSEQPAFATYNLSKAEKSRLQAVAESIHRNWPTTQSLFAPPKKAKYDLVSVEDQLLVTPPPGKTWEDMVGYVPIPISEFYPAGMGTALPHGCETDYAGKEICY